MILSRSRRRDPRLVLGAVLALVLPCAGASQVPAASAAPRQADTEAIKQRDQELDAIRADERASAENQAKLRREIEAIGEERRTLNQQLIETATRVREV